MPIGAKRTHRGTDRDFAYLVRLTAKYSLNPAALHRALTEARTNGKAKCGCLSIEQRERKDHSLCFMFSKDGGPVGQAVLAESSIAKLKEAPQELKRGIPSESRRSAADAQGKGESRIADLQIGLRHVTVKAKITEKSEIRAVYSRDGSPLAICVATLSDGTGQIRLPLWNRQIDAVAKNDTVVIRDATVRNFRGEMQLSLPWKTGTISTLNAADRSTSTPRSTNGDRGHQGHELVFAR